MGMAFAVASAVNGAADEPTFEVFSLRHCEAKVAAEALRARFPKEEQIRIAVDEAPNRLFVFADRPTPRP